MLPQNRADRPIKITSILNNFKYFNKQVYQKHRKQNINKKKDQNNQFRAEISQKQKELLKLTVKKKIEF